MDIRTVFSCGDTAWCILDGSVEPLTVGKIQAEVVDSPGINGGASEPGYPGIQFDNFKPQSSYQETVMMVETGIGSGRLYRVNETAFPTKEEAEAAIRKARWGA